MDLPSRRELFLHRVSNIVSSELSLDEMLGEIVGLTAQMTDCDACLVYLIEEASGSIVLRASQVPHAAELGLLHMEMGEGVTGWVAQHNSVVALSANAPADPRFMTFHALVEDTYQAFLSVPIVSGGKVIGAINVHHRATHEHSAEEVALVSFVGEQMGGVIEKARLREENEDMRRRLEERKLVERAKGILQHRHNLTEEQAYLYLRRESRRLRRPMKDLADAVIVAESMNQSAERILEE